MVVGSACGDKTGATPDFRPTAAGQQSCRRHGLRLLGRVHTYESTRARSTLINSAGKQNTINTIEKHSERHRSEKHHLPLSFDGRITRSSSSSSPSSEYGCWTRFEIVSHSNHRLMSRMCADVKSAEVGTRCFVMT